MFSPSQRQPRSWCQHSVSETETGALLRRAIWHAPSNTDPPCINPLNGRGVNWLHWLQPWAPECPNVGN